MTIDQRLEEAERIPHEVICLRLEAAGVPTKKDTAVRNNVEYLAKVKTDLGVYWSIARNVYKKMVSEGRI